MSHSERILAIIPSFNSERGDLARSVKSMLNQTVPVDVLIIDDGSREKARYEGPGEARVEVLRMEENGGITRALRAGVEWALSNGYDYICRLDVGDISYANRIEKQLQFMRNNQEILLLGARARVVDMSGEHLFDHGVPSGVRSVRRYAFGNAPFKHPTFFLRAAAFEEFGNYDVRFDCAEDYEFILRVASAGKVDCLSDILIEYEDNPNGISNSRRKKQLRARLRSQIEHKDLTELAFYAGILRTLVLMATPLWLAKRLSALRWRARN